ncbi:UNVERIFIED_CONTAM: hypothetical protein GTU68_002806 [Idotea baltica]|nr:hypothetical protein [Idotea baltica]
MFGHQDTRRLPAAYPQFFASGEGARLTDVDGNEYVDFMCGYGPIIVGYTDAEIEAAVAAQSSRVDCSNGPSGVMVELAEYMVETIPAADWALFAKNGTDATTACVTIARAGTGRRKLLKASGAYHGAAPWCTPYRSGTLDEDRAHHLSYDWNDIDSLHAAAREAEGDLAAILVSPFRHDARRDQEMPDPAFLTTLRKLADETGAALILDDVRAGFRLDLGGSWEPYGIRPDLSAWSKALGNGHAIAAVTGTDAWREAAKKIFITGSFWCGAAPMAAALATLQKLHRIDAVAHMERMGSLLREGIEEQAMALGVSVRQTGPVQMPMILFDDDAELEKGNLFAATALDHGAFFHPWHNMFLSAAHTEADIKQALAASRLGLEAVGRMSA